MPAKPSQPQIYITANKIAQDVPASSPRREISHHLLQSRNQTSEQKKSQSYISDNNGNKLKGFANLSATKKFATSELVVQNYSTSPSKETKNKVMTSAKRRTILSAYS